MIFPIRVRVLALNPRSVLRRSFTMNVPLTVAGTLFALAFVGTLIGLAVDHTIVTGVPAWIKPAKFMLSSAIYAFTLIWMLSFVQGHRRLIAVASWVSAISVGTEDLLITLQAARHATSHFNFSTPFDSVVWTTMGLLTIGMWGGCFLVGIALLRQRLSNPTLAWALRLGVMLALVGMSLAFFMATPTAAQLAAAKAGQGLPYSGQHTIGAAADGGPGIPFLGWSTVAGDMRIAHFVGLHGLQFLPLVAFAVMRLLPGFRTSTRTALVVIAGFAYLGCDLLLAWQALRGQSVIHPDALTLTVAATVIAATASAIAVTLLRDRRAVVLHAT